MGRRVLVSPPFPHGGPGGSVAVCSGGSCRNCGVRVRVTLRVRGPVSLLGGRILPKAVRERVGQRRN